MLIQLLLLSPELLADIHHWEMSQKCPRATEARAEGRVGDFPADFFLPLQLCRCCGVQSLLLCLIWGKVLAGAGCVSEVGNPKLRMQGGESWSGGVGSDGWRGFLVGQGWVLLRAEQPAGWACSAEGASVGFKGLIRHISVRSLPSSCFTRWNWGVWESSATSAVSSDPSLAVF